MKALAVVQVDEPVSEAVLEALKTIEALLEARLVKLPDGSESSLSRWLLPVVA